ncbi:hypothetical protein [Streptomyces sp. NPDC058812]
MAAFLARPIAGPYCPDCPRHILQKRHTLPVHRIEVEKALSGDPGATYRGCLTGRRACPPEDCGSPWNYANFIEASPPPAWGARRTPGVGWRRLRPKPVRHQGHRQTPHRPIAISGTSAAQH